ncbi:MULTISPECIES: mechanosensitive ion channel family protein [unclassified Ruegeria]|uniref:mechanosensitive ion channel family protein n=1 Tax=unclassified Ruegeria TaxID=2625375 RepID=UPI001491C356|nr:MULTISPECIES: mechanosensitive ion channel family protein [unclassified Ruegeria]NOD46656.1 mechanosensitive ion channel [Ruegeria sp. HKCCD5849]NOD50044.1 mechanosensitive ion channel [Ruegeria sp. HKCCD5851]NOD66878.1 mechanosensitive ion channel [Ruegeria sp. HKCCD7303]
MTLPFKPFLLLCYLLITISVGLTLSGPAQSQETPAEITEPEADETDSFKAPVIVDGEMLFFLRGSSALPAPERAESVQDKIIEVAEASESPAVDIAFEETDLGVRIRADGVIVSIVTVADAELDQMELDVLSFLHGQAIEEAILAYRANRTDQARVSGAIEAAGWTLGFVAFVALILWLHRRIRRRTLKLVKRYLKDVETATAKSVQAEAIAALIRYGLNFILLIIFFLGFYYYLSFVLLAFAETRYFAQLLLTYLTEPVLLIFKGILSYIPNLIMLGLITWVTMYIIKGMRVFFDAVEAGSFDMGDFEKHWVNPTFNIARVIVILIALVFAVPYIPGSDSAAFQGLTILVGAMLSLGANSVVSNMLAGLFVIYRRSTSIGDRIQIGDHIGDVVQIKLMETHLKSIKNELISIPNAQLMNSDVVNFSKKTDGSGLLLHTTVGIGYEEPPEKVEAMLIEAANRTKGIKAKPEPFVLWTALADYAINYQINGYTTRGSIIPKIRSDLHRNIVAVFNENGVQIMTPSYMADPPEPKIPAEEWDGHLAHEIHAEDDKS